MKHESSSTYNTSTKKPGIYDRIRNNHVLQQILRVFQFLSSIISLALFSARLYKIVRTARRASNSNGSVEGILIGAVIYTLISMLMKFAMKTGGPKIFRWIWIFFDILFVAAFIVVAVLTRPGGGTSGPCHYVRGVRIEPNGSNCNLPWGTFILALVSIVLHLLTALFIEGRDYFKDHKHNKHNKKDSYDHHGNHNNRNDHNDYDNRNGHTNGTALNGNHNDYDNRNGTGHNNGIHLNGNHNGHNDGSNLNNNHNNNNHNNNNHNNNNMHNNNGQDGNMVYDHVTATNNNVRSY